MQFQQIKDLMLYLEQLHHCRFSYGRQIPRVDGERSRMLLAYLQGREDVVAHLHDHREQMGKAVRRPGWIRDSARICWRSASAAGAGGPALQPGGDSGPGCAQQRRGSSPSWSACRECPTPDTRGTAEGPGTRMARSRLTRLVHGAHPARTTSEPRDRAEAWICRAA